MSRPLKFKIKDYDFISRKFPSYYGLLVPHATRHGDEMWIDTKDQEAYDYLLDNLCLELGDALDDEANLNKDGLHLESAWDYADREGKPIGETKK